MKKETLADKRIDVIAGTPKYYEKDVRRFIQDLKVRNANQRRFLPGWRNLSKAELYQHLVDTLRCFDEDIDEFAGEKLANHSPQKTRNYGESPETEEVGTEDTHAQEKEDET